MILIDNVPAQEIGRQLLARFGLRTDQTPQQVFCKKCKQLKLRIEFDDGRFHKTRTGLSSDKCVECKLNRNEK